MNPVRLFAPGLLAITLVIQPGLSEAANLIEVFRLSEKNDPQWAARKARFLADKESVEQARGTLRPQAQAGMKWAQIQTDAPSGNVDEQTSQDCSDSIRGITGASTDANGNGVADDAVDTGDLVGLRSCGDLFASLISALSTTEKKTNNLMQYQLTATQPLFRLDRYYGRTAAESALSAAQADLGAAQQDLMLRSAEAYFNLLKTQEDLRLAKAEQRTLAAALAEVKNRYRVGLARDTDVYETQSSYDIASAAVIVADSEVANATEMLALMTAEDGLMIDPLPNDVPIESPRPLTVADWEEQARRNNLTLLASRFLVAARKQETASKRAGHSPTVDLVADYSKFAYTGDTETENDTTTLGINLTIPLYMGGITSSQERQARHRQAEAQDNAELAMRNALRETRQYHTRVVADVQAVKARASAVRSSASAYRSMKLGYDNGVRTLTDVLGAQRTLFQARKDYATSRFLYIINTLRLKKAAGVLAENDLEVLNGWLTTRTPAPEENDVLGGMTLEEIDGIRLEGARTVTEAPTRKSRHKSLYDAFKAWQAEE